MNRHIRITFARYINGERREYEASGRIAQALWYLVEMKEQGITALEVSNWALRLGAYVHVLRHDYHLDIATLMEPHDGGHHARYVLRTPVEILDVKQLKP